jgi:hypothetical protein
MKKAAVSSILIAVVLLAVGVIAEAQQPKKVPRMGIYRRTIQILKAGQRNQTKRLPYSFLNRALQLSQ